MATLKATIRKAVINNDGETTVQIAVCHKTKTAYISTDIKVKPGDFMGGMVVSGSKKNVINAKIIALLNDYKEKLDCIDNIDAKDVIQIKDELSIKRVQPYKMVSQAYDLYISQCTNRNTIESYRNSQKVFNVFCKEHDMAIAAVDCRYIERYHQWIKTFEPNKPQRAEMHGKLTKQNCELRKTFSEATVATYMSHLKAVINKAIKEGWVSYKVHPFAKTEIHRGNTRLNILDAYDMKKILDYRPKKEKHKLCRDIFMLTFYLGGANLADLLVMDFRRDSVTFERKKVASRTRGGAVITLPVIQEAREIVNRYINPDNGRLSIGATNTLHRDMNYYIKVIANDVGIDKYITFSSARKAVAQIACDMGVNDNYVNYILGHSMAKARGMLDPYSKVQGAMAGEILKALANIINTPERVEEIFQENINKMLGK